MAIYTPPTGDNILFELVEYTEPEGDSLEFVLLPVAETVSDSFNLEWALEAIKYDSFNLEWALKDIYSSSFNLEWQLNNKERFYNLFTYPVKVSTPTISDYTYSAPIVGCLDSIIIDMENTGDSGNTIIKVYLNDVLKQTVTISSDNSEYNSLVKLNNDIISTEDEIKISVTSVATNSSNLNIAIQQKTFSERLDIIKATNSRTGMEFESKYSFGDSDYWKFYFNQPISSLIKVAAKKNTGEEEELTYSLDSADRGNNLVIVTPEDLTRYTEIIFSIKNIVSNDVKEHHFKLNYRSKLSQYPSYVLDTFSFTTYTEAVKCYYSWDNSTWYSVNTVDGAISINNLPSTDGSKTLYLRYFLDTLGKKVIYDSTGLEYYTSNVSSTIDSSDLSLTYSDEIPPDKVEVYIDDVLEETIDIPIKITGINSYSYNNETFVLTVTGGTVYEKKNMYTIADTEFTIADSFDIDNIFIYKVVYFDIESKSMEIKTISSDYDLNLKFKELNNSNQIPIYKFVFSPERKTDEDGVLVYERYKLVNATRVFKSVLLPSYLKGEIKYKVYDILGRTKEITFNSYYNDTLYYDYALSVTDTNDNEIKQGQIHSEENLKFTISDRS